MNIATEFNEFKGNLFNKKIMRHKMRRIQSINLEHTKSTNYHCVLMISDTLKMIALIHLHIFTKTKIFKDEKEEIPTYEKKSS